MVALLAFPAGAGAVSWGRSVALSPVVAGAPRPEVASDARGDTVVSWIDGVLYADEGVYDAYRPAGGKFSGREHVVTAAPGKVLLLARPVVARDGTATLSWLLQPSVKTVQRRASGGFAPIQTVGADPYGLSVAQSSDAEGDGSVVWVVGDGIHEAHRIVGGPFGAEVVLPGSRVLNDPVVGASSGGAALVAWIDDHGRVQAAFRRSGGAFGPPRPVTTDPSNESGYTSPVLATNEAGASVLAWPSSGGHIEVAVGRDGIFGAPQDLGAGFGPEVAINARGDAAVTWAGGDLPRTRVAFRAPGGSFGASTAVGGCSADGNYIGGGGRVVLDAAGDALVAWSETPAIRRPGLHHLASAVRPVGGTLGAPEFITAPEEMLGQPDIAIDGAGRITAAWTSQASPGGYAGSVIIRAATTTAPLAVLARSTVPAPPGTPASCHPARPLAAPAPPAPHLELEATVHTPRNAPPRFEVSCPRASPVACSGTVTLAARVSGS